MDGSRHKRRRKHPSSSAVNSVGSQLEKNRNVDYRVANIFSEPDFTDGYILRGMIGHGARKFLDLAHE